MTKTQTWKQSLEQRDRDVIHNQKIRDACWILIGVSSFRIMWRKESNSMLSINVLCLLAWIKTGFLLKLILSFIPFWIATKKFLWSVKCYWRISSTYIIDNNFSIQLLNSLFKRNSYHPIFDWNRDQLYLVRVWRWKQLLIICVKWRNTEV